jgi:hypothetical protein
MGGPGTARVQTVSPVINAAAAQKERIIELLYRSPVLVCVE